MEVIISKYTKVMIDYSETERYSKENKNFADDVVEISHEIRSKLRKLSISGFVFNKQQLRDMCDLQWSLDTFKLMKPYPFARIVDGHTIVSELAKDEFGYYRYWNEVFAFGNNNLLFTSQWHEGNYKYFNKWLSTLNFVSRGYNFQSNEISDIKNYDSLKQWLTNNGNDIILMSFSEIDDLVGGMLPCAYWLPSVWSNTKIGPFSVAWLSAGYMVDNCNFRSQSVCFVRADLLKSTQPDTSISPDFTSKIYRSVEKHEKERIISILVKKFSTGFRKSSNIDFERFKNFYKEEYNEEFKHNEELINYFLTTEALIYDDRAYIYDNEVVKSVRFYLLQMNSLCIFIHAFFNKYLNEFYLFNIFSVEMLRVFIEMNYSDVSIKRDYILLKKNISPSDLVKEVFSERTIWSIHELKERLPYLKIDTIRQTMNGSEYLWVDKETYTHISNIDLPDSEGEKIVTFIENKLQDRDYITIKELDMSKFESLNSHCSYTTIRDAVFSKFLSNKYEKNGQIITNKGYKLCVLDILEHYCHKRKMVSLEELNALEATFDKIGKTHSQCLIAGHNTMIRVNAELFVSDSYVNFNTVLIDEAIELYCHCNFIPLREITDFSLFPYTGYTWNLFLLESYVRKFSRVFDYDVRATNSSNIGVIIRKSFSYNDYDDILTFALAKSSVELNDKEAVGNYLFNNGYIGRRNLGKDESKIIRNAKVLREGK